MYIIGAIEAISVATGIEIGPPALSIRLMSVFLLILILIVNVFGTGLIAKTGMVFLVITIASILAMLIGIFTAFFRDNTEAGITGMSWNNFYDNFSSDYSDDSSFFV